MSIIAGYCVLAVLVLRWLFRKAPKKYTYLLWLVVAFRLVCPLTVDSAFSIFNLKLLPESVRVESELDDGSVELPGTNVPNVKPEVGGDVGEQPGIAPEIGGNVGEQPGSLPEVGGNLVVQPDITPEIDGTVIENPGKLPEMQDGLEQALQTKLFREIDWMKVGAWLWLAGIVGLTATMVTSWIRLRLRVRTAVKVKTRVYETDEIDSAFVMGIRKPTIYLPMGLNRQEQAWILLHETCHIWRKDYLMKMFATILTIVYWFHPLVWVAWFGMCRDMEMSCDEMALEGADAELRKGYSRTLLTVAANKRLNWNVITAFGEVSVKSRIKHVLSFKKPAVWMGAMFAVVLVAALVVFGTNGQANDDANAGQNIEEETTSEADGQLPESEEPKTEDSEPDDVGIKIPEKKEPVSKMDAMTNALWLKMLSNIDRFTKIYWYDKAGTQEDPFNESYNVEMILKSFDYIDDAYNVYVLYNDRVMAEFYWHWTNSAWIEGSMNPQNVDTDRFSYYYLYAGEPCTGWCEGQYLDAKENTALQITGSVKKESYTQDEVFINSSYHYQWSWGTMLRIAGDLWQRFNGDYLGQMVGEVYMTSFDVETLTGVYWICLEGEAPVQLTMTLNQIQGGFSSQIDTSAEWSEDIPSQTLMKMTFDLTMTANTVETEVNEEERFATWKENVWSAFKDYERARPWYEDYGMFRHSVSDYDGDGVIDRKFFYILEDDYGVEYLLLSSGRMIELGETYADKSHKVGGLDAAGDVILLEGDEWIDQAWEDFKKPSQINTDYLETATEAWPFADQYTGFLDEHPLREDIDKDDFDGDGLDDRLFQRYNEEKDTQEVYLFFGSGEMLLLEVEVSTMFYGVEAADLTGDGTNELLFTHHILAADDDGNTYFSIFTKDNGSWKRMELPGERSNRDGGYASSHRETFRLDVVNDQTIKVSHPDCSSIAELTVSKYVMDLEVRCMQGEQGMSLMFANGVSIEPNSEIGHAALRLHGRIGDRWEWRSFSWLLGYVDGEWKVLAVENK